MKYFVWTLVGYLCGSLMFSSLVSKYLCNIDIGTISDDKNPGAGNVFKYVGTGWGILCLVLDIGKGFLPVWMAARMAGVESILFALVIAAPVAGHAFPVFHKWKGGKAIAVTFGVLLGISSYSDAVWLLACLLILFTGILVVRPHHVRVILSFLLFAVWCGFHIRIPSILYGCYLITLFVIVKHLLAPNQGKWEVRFYPAGLLRSIKEHCVSTYPDLRHGKWRGEHDKREKERSE